MELDGRLSELQRSLSATLVPPDRQSLPDRPQALTRRLGKITAVSFSAGTCEVLLNNATLSGLRWLQSYCPRVDDFVWLEFAGGKDPIVIGGENTGLAQQSPFHTIGMAGEPAFTNGWHVYPGTSGATFTRIGQLVVVQAQLEVTGAAYTVAFTIPVGYRPYDTIYWYGYNATLWYVNVSGQVVPVSASSNRYFLIGSYVASN